MLIVGSELLVQLCCIGTRVHGQESIQAWHDSAMVGVVQVCGQAEDLHDPEQNVYCGAQVLSHLLERCSGDITCALSAYNVGPYASRAAAANRYIKKIDRYLSSFDERTL